MDLDTEFIAHNGLGAWSHASISKDRLEKIHMATIESLKIGIKHIASFSMGDVVCYGRVKVWKPERPSLSGGSSLVALTVLVSVTETRSCSSLSKTKISC